MRFVSGKFSTLTAALVLLAVVPSYAADDESGAWLITVASDRFPSSGEPSRWRYWLEVQARYPDFGSGANQLLFRPGIGYDISPTVSAFAGYARFRTHPPSGATSTEDRFWQHIAWRFRSWEQSSLTMRLRLEQRMPSTGSDTGHFLRYQLKYVRRLVAGGDTDFIASIEPFWDLRDTDYGAASGLAQNRIYLGLGWKLAPKSSLEVGYQNQYFYLDARPDRSRHLAMLNFKTRF